MHLGLFSLSLSVKDLNLSIDFYQKIGFEIFHDQRQHNWVIMKNGDSVIGLFSGMFDVNIMTFNPGWDANAEQLAEYDDVRTLQSTIKQRGISLEKEADADGQGPASFVLKDPDGNVILIDQHV